mgnify:CR=1 FL=1
MRRKLVAGNWKMNGSRESIRQLVAGFRLQGYTDDLSIVICPTTLHLTELGSLLRGSASTKGVALGAQNTSAAAPGALTGEVAACMLAEVGVEMVLAGHSERRELFGESDEEVASKAEAILGAGMTPIVCIGETLTQRQAGETEAIVLRQLNAVAQRIGVEGLARSVWARGTGETATPSQAQAVHAALRARLAELDAELADKTPILYGGSVKAGNASELFAQPDIDGGLVGGASLSAEEFNAICASALAVG